VWLENRFLGHLPTPAHFPDAEGFQQQSDNFMSWLQASPGVQLNPKLNEGRNEVDTGREEENNGEEGKEEESREYAN
jgi:hypothetical protein